MDHALAGIVLPLLPRIGEILPALKAFGGKVVQASQVGGAVGDDHGDEPPRPPVVGDLSAPVAEVVVCLEGAGHRGRQPWGHGRRIAAWRHGTTSPVTEDRTEHQPDQRTRTHHSGVYGAASLAASGALAAVSGPLSSAVNESSMAIMFCRSASASGCRAADSVWDCTSEETSTESGAGRSLLDRRGSFRLGRARPVIEAETSGPMSAATISVAAARPADQRRCGSCIASRSPFPGPAREWRGVWRRLPRASGGRRWSRTPERAGRADERCMEQGLGLLEALVGGTARQADAQVRGDVAHLGHVQHPIQVGRKLFPVWV